MNSNYVLGYCRHSNGICADGSQKSYQLSSQDLVLALHVHAFCTRIFKSSEACSASAMSSLLYASDISGNRGPISSSLGPISGLSPSKLMWSEMSMTSPFLKSGLSAPAAFDTRTIHTEIFHHANGKVICFRLYPS